jgi:crossover junction endodeoxyribonuclease RuvC
MSDSVQRQATCAGADGIPDGALILGLDPGLSITGYGGIRIERGQATVVEAGVIRSSRGGPFPQRLATIFAGISEVLTSLKPDVIALEELFSHYDRPKTAILMGHARGILCLAAAQREIPMAHYAATQIKRLLTGNGRASKAQMQMAIGTQLGLLQLPEPPDVADALAVALCHHFMSRRSASLL